MVEKFNLDKKHQVKIPGKKDWNKGRSVKADSNWYTDSSKTEYGAVIGAGIHKRMRRKVILLSFS